MFVSLCVSVYVVISMCEPCMYAGTSLGQERTLELSKLELQGIVFIYAGGGSKNLQDSEV